MNAQLEARLTAEIGQVIDDHIAPIFKPGALITVLVRHPGMDDADAAVTSDNDDGVHAIVQRRFPRANDQAAEIARLSAALDTALAQLERERARRATLKPVAWVRRHPDGALTNQFLEDAVIEPVRKASGAWLPLAIIPGGTK